MQRYFYRPALALMLGVSSFATSAAVQAQSGQVVPTVQTAPQAQPKVQAIAADTASTPPICYAGYGLQPKQKIKVCTDVIDSGSVKGLGMGLAYFSRGMARANDGDSKGSVNDYRTALRFYTDVIRSSPPQAQVVFQRGLIYHQMGDADQAIVDYSDAIRLSPRDTYAYVNRGIVLYTKKDNNEGAISDFDSALKLNRCETTAWINRGLTYKRKGNLNQSIADFTDAIKCLPANAPTVTTVTVDPSGKPFAAQYYQAMTQSSQLADAYYQRGLVYLDKGSKDKQQAIPMYNTAIKDFNDAIRINPTAAAHFVGRASAQMYKEEFREAIADFTEAIRLSPGDEFTFLHRGIAYHSVNEPDNAIADYSEAHRINPLDVAPLLNRGIVYYSKKGQYDLAIKDFTDCLKLDPKEVNCLINRGISWREKGDADKAIVDFSEALRLGLLTGDVLQFGSKDPEAVRHWAQVAHARYQRGTAYVLKTEYDLALADFNESIRLNPTEARVYVSRGGVYLARQDYKRAITDFSEGIRLDPEYAFAYFQRGFAYHALEEPDKAYDDYTMAIRWDPKYITSYLNRGIILYTRRGDFEAGITDFTTALRLGPDNINALMHRGVAQGANGEFDKGFADLNRAIELSPEFARAYYYRGVLFSLRGSADRALADYTAALRLDNKSAEAYVARAAIYAQLNQHDKAIADLTDAIKILPNASGPFYNRGYSYFAKGQYDRAAADYSEAIRLNPRMAVAYNNRCLTRGITSNDPTEALRDCDEALKLLPGNIDAHDTRGFIYLKLGDFPVAINEYNASLQADPNHARALFGRGLAKMKSGDRQGGDADMAAAVKIAPKVAEDFSRFGMK
jgi:tetratricopeptide (TPR) repeat protein